MACGQRPNSASKRQQPTRKEERRTPQLCPLVPTEILGLTWTRRNGREKSGVKQWQGRKKSPAANRTPSTITSRCRPCETHDERCPHVQDSHRHERFTSKNKTMENSVLREFETFLRDIPLFQGTSSGLAPVQGKPLPSPHENLHRPGDLNDDGSPVEATSSFPTMSQSTASQRSTTSAKKLLNYCSITLYPEGIKWVALESSKGKDGDPDACRASTGNAHAPGIDGCTARSKSTRGGRQEDPICSCHATATGCEGWVFDDMGAVPPVLACLKPPEWRATALLRMRCFMFNGLDGIGRGYTILKGAAEYMPADYDGSVGQIAIDVDNTRDIQPD